MSVHSGKWLFGSRNLLFAGLMLAGAASAQPPSVSAVKIGYIDVHRLIDNSPQMVEAQAKIKREFAARDEAIRADDAKLAALRQRYERDSAIMTREDADALKRELDATERANKRMKDEARADINDRGKVEWNRVSRLIQETAIEYGRAQGYDIVIGSESALYANPRMDITDAVLQRLKQVYAGAAKP